MRRPGRKIASGKFTGSKRRLPRQGRCGVRRFGEERGQGSASGTTLVRHPEKHLGKFFPSDSGKARDKAGGGDQKSGMENLPYPIPDQGTARDKADAAFVASGKSVDKARQAGEGPTETEARRFCSGKFAGTESRGRGWKPLASGKFTGPECRGNRRGNGDEGGTDYLERQQTHIDVVGIDGSREASRRPQRPGLR